MFPRAAVVAQRETTRLVTEIWWVEILPDAGLFSASLSSSKCILNSGPSRRCNTTLAMQLEANRGLSKKHYVALFQDKLKCFSGLPDVNAGRQILNVMKLECPEVPKADHVQTAIGHSITHALLSLLLPATNVNGWWPNSSSTSPPSSPYSHLLFSGGSSSTSTRHWWPSY